MAKLVLLILLIGFPSVTSAAAWCRYPNSFLFNYAGRAYTTMRAAINACKRNAKCNGITQEPNNKNRYTERVGPQIQSWSPTGETSWAPCPTTANWCEYKDSFLYNYAGPSFTTLEDAQLACLANKKCNGITQEPYNNNVYTQRAGPTIHNTSPSGETSWAVCSAFSNWCEYKNSFLYSYAATSGYDNLQDAQRACLANSYCKGITQEPYNNNRYTLRIGPQIFGTSPSGETSWVLCPTS